MATSKRCSCCKSHAECCICWTIGEYSWTKSLVGAPNFVPRTWTDWLATGGKGDTGAKSWKFFKEAYVHDILIAINVTEDSRSDVIIRARCFRSMKKNEDPHTILVCAQSASFAQVSKAHCSCKAGSGGHCNHIFALLFQLNDYSCSELKSIPIDGTCTSRPQKWHIPRATKISSFPVMGTHFANTATNKNTEERMRNPTRCKLYEATYGRKSLPSSDSIMKQVSYLKSLENPPPFSYLLSDQEPSIQVNTALGDFPIGSCLSYQLFDFGRKKTRFQCPPVQMVENSGVCLHFPDVPCVPKGTYFDKSILMFQEREEWVERKISITVAEAWELKKRTVLQGGCKEWVEQHKTRLTASNFGKINQQIKKPSEAMLSNIFFPPDLSKVASIAHGRSKEKLARSIYASRMQGKIKNFCVFDAGIVVNPAYPYIGASPDGKVFNPSISPQYGLLEVK